MCGDKKKVKYYRIRVSVFWIAIVGIVTLAIVIVAGNWQRKSKEQEKEQT